LTIAAKSLTTLAEPHRMRNGVLAAVAANLIWGFFPVLFNLLDGVDPVLVVAHRIVWSLLLVGAILVFGGRWGETLSVLRDRRTLVRLLVSAALLTVNWLIYVWAVENGQVLETSFGYFVNPLANVALGMVLLGERQNRWQAVSIGIGVIAMLIQAAGVGGVPWVSLGVAGSFAHYSYMRKTVKANSATGLFVETLLLSPLAALYIAWSVASAGPGPHADPRLFGLLVFTGPATTAALLFFAYAVQRLRLTTTGVIQYIAPSMQFLLAIFYFGEALNPLRLFGFALIWLSLAVFTADSLRRRRPLRAAGIESI
jgi:chloramphenicol-sensitive protein RarD